ncbi:hypothetical protein, partial [Burkholderia vietnamiensis]|uniref:hypothetical protein n=1 Tax=Burkholderia vietnamiensis TaxID=60552 RepID=UPI001ABBC115
IPCSKIEQGIQSRGSKFDENYSLRWVSSAWTSTLTAPTDLEALLEACATHARLLNEVALRE